MILYTLDCMENNKIQFGIVTAHNHKKWYRGVPVIFDGKDMFKFLKKKTLVRGEVLRSSGREFQAARERKTLKKWKLE